MTMTTKKSDAKDGEPQRKKAKYGRDDLDDIIEQAWNHYRNYTDSTNDSEINGGCGDDDELVELLAVLEPLHIEPFDDEDIRSLTTKQDLLPVLISVASYVLADKAIEHYLQEFEYQSLTSDENNGEDSEIPVDDVKKYLEMSLLMFSQNAAAWSMAANFARITFRLNPLEKKIAWYEKSASTAARIRTQAIQMLEDNEDVIEDDVKEWIELLLLNQIAGVEVLLVPHSRKEEVTEGSPEVNKEKDIIAVEEDSKEVWSASSVEGTARFMLAMLYSISGSHDEALEQLKHFPHLTHRINPNFWKNARLAVENKTSSAMKKRSPSEPALYRRTNGGIIPCNLFEHIRKVFAPKAPYWSESDYSNRGYYSYFMDLPKELIGKKDEGASEPFTGTNVIEDVVCNYLLPIVKKHLMEAGQTEDAEKICGYEWWVHTRPIKANLGHNLHFDTDEALLEQEKKVTHPIVSSVLYLTGDNLAGPTLLLDQTPISKENASRGWLNVPENNTLLLFPGDLLHGVLPCLGTQSLPNETSSKSKSELLNRSDLFANEGTGQKDVKCNLPKPFRLTLMVGFWTRRVPDNMKEQKLYGPCGQLPPYPSKKTKSDNNAYKQEHTWVEAIQEGYTGEAQGKRTNIDDIMACGLQTIEPAWEEFRGCNKKDELESHLEIPRGIDHRFFVPNAPQCFYDSLFEKDEDDYDSESFEGEDESFDDEEGEGA